MCVCAFSSQSAPSLPLGRGGEHVVAAFQKRIISSSPSKCYDRISDRYSSVHYICTLRVLLYGYGHYGCSLSFFRLVFPTYIICAPTIFSFFLLNMWPCNCYMGQYSTKWPVCATYSLVYTAHLQPPYMMALLLSFKRMCRVTVSFAFETLFGKQRNNAQPYARGAQNTFAHICSVFMVYKHTLSCRLHLQPMSPPVLLLLL